MIQAHQHINQDSGDVERYTPGAIIEAARMAMGSIDLDPASSAKANTAVRAGTYYTKERDGLVAPWFGNVWLNHPYGRKANPLWINRLINDYEHGVIDQACCITFAATGARWFRPLLLYPQCFLHGRTRFDSPNGGTTNNPTKECVVTYLGPKIKTWLFAEAFEHLGTVKVPLSFVTDYL